MGSKIIFILTESFDACIRWAEDIFSATGGTSWIIAGFIVYLTVSLILMPFRGARVGGGIGEYTDVVRGKRPRSSGSRRSSPSGSRRSSPSGSRRAGSGGGS